jgi:hypothetical protein
MLALVNEADVHRADFLDVLVLDGVQPAHLLEPEAAHPLRDVETRGVVAPRLGVPRAALDRAHQLTRDIYLHRLEPVREIRPHRPRDDEVQIALAAVHAESDVRRDHRGADVKRGFGL